MAASTARATAAANAQAGKSGGQPGGAKKPGGALPTARQYAAIRAQMKAEHAAAVRDANAAVALVATKPTPQRQAMTRELLASAEAHREQIRIASTKFFKAHLGGGSPWGYSEAATKGMTRAQRSQFATFQREAVIRADQSLRKIDSSTMQAWRSDKTLFDSVLGGPTRLNLPDADPVKDPGEYRRQLASLTALKEWGDRKDKLPRALAPAGITKDKWGHRLIDKRAEGTYIGTSVGWYASMDKDKNKTVTLKELSSYMRAHNIESFAYMPGAKDDLLDLRYAAAEWTFEEAPKRKP